MLLKERFVTAQTALMDAGQQKATELLLLAAPSSVYASYDEHTGANRLRVRLDCNHLHTTPGFG